MLAPLENFLAPLLGTTKLVSCIVKTQAKVTLGP